MTMAKERKRVKKLKEELQFLTDTPMNKHTVFVDTEDEVEDFEAAEYFDTAEELVGSCSVSCSCSTPPSPSLLQSVTLMY